MSALIDIIGKRFGRLTVFSYAGRARWNCLCSCGSFSVPEGANLRNGHTLSCGCYKRDRTSATHRTHGLAGTRVYGLYRDMINRCYRPQVKSFDCYGGRGISVCEEWRSGFEPFYEWAVLNGYRRGLTLDRIEVNGNYEPTNCRFVTRIESARNTRTNVFIEHEGQSKTMAEWALVFMIPYKLLQQRLVRDGLSFSEAVTKPIRQMVGVMPSKKYSTGNITPYARRNSKATSFGSGDPSQLRPAL